MATIEEQRLVGVQGNPLVEGLERVPVAPTTLVLFGATGDLAMRKLLPALYNLAHDGLAAGALQSDRASRAVT